MNNHSFDNKGCHITMVSWWFGSALVVLWVGILGCQSTAEGRSFNRLKDNVKQRRVALVIGNAVYREERDWLVNPVNDAEDISKDLRKFGFIVTTKRNASNEAMDAAVAAFGRQATNADVALFYYAGHGVQSKGRNYLIPVDAALESEASLPYKTMDLNRVLDELDNAKSRIKIVMVDACRDNSLIGSKEFRQKDLGTRGLAAPTVSKGTVIVYATAPGEVASDNRRGRNGLFTEGLRKAFTQGKNLNLGGVLTEASRWVEQHSAGVQVPYVNGPMTLQQDFYFAGSAVEQERQPEQVAKEAEEERLRREQVAKEAEERLRREQVAKETEERLRREQVAKDAEERLRREQVAKETEERLRREQVAKETEERLRREQVAKEAEEARLLKLRQRESVTKSLISGRYRDNGDGTVTDTTTNLMWQRCSEGQTWDGNTCVGEAVEMTWNDAMPGEKQKDWRSFAGYSDWRMPSIEVLRSLVYCSNGMPPEEAWDSSCSGKDERNGEYQRPTIDLVAFPNTPTRWFWSSSPHAFNAVGAWVVGFSYGGDGSSYRSYYYPVRLVRAGQ